MSGPAPPILRRRLQFRLALLLGAAFLIAGIFFLAVPDLLLYSTRSTREVGTSVGSALAAQHQSDLRLLVLGSIVAVAALVPVSVGIGWLSAGRLLRPLRTITATARDISATNLRRRLELGPGDDELTQLGATLNDLFGRLEASFESQRRFIANASHELRTPLAGQRTMIQVALADPDASTDDLRAACEEALALGEMEQRLIDALLVLATSEKGVERWEAVDLAQTAERVLSARLREAERLDLRISSTLHAAPTAGDPRLIESLVTNLIDNAMRHNTSGGSVEVSTAADAVSATFRVSNDGPAVPPEQVDRLIQPFRQLRSDRTGPGRGYGLGLAIVKAIADAHGAKLSVKPRVEGGLAVSVSFIRDATRRDAVGAVGAGPRAAG
jgi:signal transduction histidine kinase